MLGIIFGRKAASHTPRTRGPLLVLQLLGGAASPGREGFFCLWRGTGGDSGEHGSTCRMRESRIRTWMKLCPGLFILSSTRTSRGTQSLQRELVKAVLPGLKPQRSFAFTLLSFAVGVELSPGPPDLTSKRGVRLPCLEPASLTLSCPTFGRSSRNAIKTSPFSQGRRRKRLFPKAPCHGGLIPIGFQSDLTRGSREPALLTPGSSLGSVSRLGFAPALILGT